jgi:glycosyltransferase involved in cell wall biosynthesis
VRILIASTYVPFVPGGATKIVHDLRDELRARGFETDTVLLPFDGSWPSVPEQTLGLRLLDLREACGMRVDRLITVRYPSYALRHDDKVCWFIHHHREAYDLWGTAYSGMPDSPTGRHYRDMMRKSDDLYLRECRKVFTNSRVMAERLKKFNALDADGVLYPPLPRQHPFCPGPFGDYLFYPSRITSIKRQVLAVEALRFTDPGLRLVLGGAPDSDAEQVALEAAIDAAGVGDRVVLTGWLSEQQKADLMAGCCGALYLAYNEDSYGYVTLEAFHSAKPVLTLSDSGGSLEVVENGFNGYVTLPEPQALAEAMNRLWLDRRHAQDLGEAGRGTLQRHRIDWDHVVESLTS